MKTLNKISMQLFYALTIFISVAFSSCSEKEEVVTPQFPELKEITGKVGDVLDVTFSANLDWTIKSDASWCKFVNGEFKEVTANGKAGEQTLKIELSDESWNPSTADVAQLTLSMNNQSQVIYKVTRSAKELQNLVVTNEDGTVTYDAEHPLTIKGSGLRDVPSDIVYTIIKATADVNVGVIEKPNWLSVTNEGNGVFKLIFDKGNSEGISPINSFGVDKGYKLVVATEDYNSVETDKVRKVEIPLSYEGLKANYVEFKNKEDYAFNLYASPDGKTFKSKTTDISTGEEQDGETFNAPLAINNIIARDGKYVIKCFEAEEQKAFGATYYKYNANVEASWIIQTETTSGTEITVKELKDKTRGSILMIFSEAHWNSILTDSVSKYGSLQDALFYKESQGNVDAYYVNPGYELNQWINIFQNKDEIIEDISFDAYYYSKFGEEDPIWFPINRLEGVKLEDISGTPEAENDSLIDNVWKITCPNTITIDKDNCLAIEAKGLKDGDIFGKMNSDEGVTIGTIEKDGNTLCTVIAPDYIGEVASLVVMDSFKRFKALLIINITDGSSK